MRNTGDTSARLSRKAAGKFVRVAKRLGIPARELYEHTADVLDEVIVAAPARESINPVKEALAARSQ